MRKQTFEGVAENFTAVHKGKYTYPPQVYRGTKSKVRIICPTHGEFEQQAAIHKRGAGCPSCSLALGGAKRTLGIIEIQRQIQNLSPEYTILCDSDDKVVKVTDKIQVVCPEHGVFLSSAHQLKKGQGCPSCGKIKSATARKITLDEFISRAVTTHNNRYDYSLVKLDSFMGKVEIICKDHGPFLQSAQSHCYGQGCPKCYAQRRLNRNIESMISFQDFIARAVAVHRGAYSYIEDTYQGMSRRVAVVCPKHGGFEQFASDHVNGSRCPVCAMAVSEGQLSLLAFIKTLGIEAINNYRYGVGKKEVDIYIPSKSLAIEFDGAWFHSTKYKSPTYHVNKRKEVISAGTNLIRVFDDEWKFREASVKAMILARLGLLSDKVYARTCSVVEISNETAQQFHNEHHIQGFTGYGESLALVFNGEFCAVMTFSKRHAHRGYVADTGAWELVRFSSKIRVVGGASKLFSHLILKCKATRVVSYSDNRLFDGRVYEALGFYKAHETKPSYTYIHNGGKMREHKSGFRRAKLLKKLGRFDPTRTERENCEDAGYYQVYDCGLTKWLWESHC